MTNWEVSENIEIPESKRGRKPKYPFTKMEVGQSVFFPSTKPGGKEAMTAYTTGKRLGFKFVVRAEGDGVRVWRTE